MLEAVIHGKAKMERILDGVGKQPREDLVTSSIVGSIRILSPASQARAFSVLSGYQIEGLIEIHLWPRFRGEGRGWVEPDVVLKFDVVNGPVYWLIEVKWGADLGGGQETREVEALKSAPCIRGSLGLGPRNVFGYTLLGFEPKHAVAMKEFQAKSSENIRVERRAWSDITRDLRTMLSGYGLDRDLMAWGEMVHDFLQILPQGKVLTDWPKVDVPSTLSYSFGVLERIENWNLIQPIEVAKFEFGV